MFSKIGLQLYTIRDYMSDADTMRESFKKLKAIGYDQAQTAGSGGISHKEMAQIAKEEGIEIVGTHYNFGLIKNDLEALIDKYTPDEMAIEELFFNTNITTGIAVAEARGVILCTAHAKGLKISEYTPLQVKQAVVGYGKAEKRQVIAMVTSILKLKSPPKPDDTADAVAIAICHSQCAGSAIGKYFNQR